MTILAGQLSPLGAATVRPPQGDADATAFLTAAGITDPTQTAAVDQLVLDLKAAGVWSKLLAVYPFVGGSAASHKWNLKDPRDTDDAFRGVFGPGWTHSATGAKPNGAGGMNTKMIGNTRSRTDMSWSFYSRSNRQSTLESDFGINDAGCEVLTDYGTAYIDVPNFAFDRLAITPRPNTLGLFAQSLTGTGKPVYHRGDLWNAGAGAPSYDFSSSPFVFGSGAFDRHSYRELAFASIGTALTGTEQADLYTAVQAYQTTLGRQV